MGSPLIGALMQASGPTNNYGDFRREQCAAITNPEHRIALGCPPDEAAPSVIQPSLGEWGVASYDRGDAPPPYANSPGYAAWDAARRTAGAQEALRRLLNK